MSETKTTSASRHYPKLDTPYDTYHRIHKKFVGPATAPLLVELHDSLTEVQQPREMYAAGWAAAEASLVGEQFGLEERVKLARTAQDCWQYALQLEQERAANSAWLKGVWPDSTDQYRIASTLALAPIIEAIPGGIIPKRTLHTCQDSLLSVAELNYHDMQVAISSGITGRASSHLGVAYEQIAPLGINRLMSSRIVGLFSLARSGTGYYYPKQTHDVMVLNLEKNKITRVTPTEVKSTLKIKVSNRYDAALFGGKATLGKPREMIGTALDAFRDELNGTVTVEQLELLESISHAIIHSIRHHHRAEKFGRHCLNMDTCKLEAAS
ncbi:MAG: hypothetical protein ABIR46_03890 [Candidatus Saccharimonadales bacterium]